MNKKCPGCGASIDVNLKNARVLACDYCNAIIENDKDVLKKIGEQSEFIEFPSIFEVGETKKFNEIDYSVKGQVRYEYSGGFFSKFYATSYDKAYIIRVDDGDTMVTQEKILDDFNCNLTELEAGEKIKIGEKQYLVGESGYADIAGIKGYINTRIGHGNTVYYVDAVHNKDRVFLEQDIITKKIIIGELID